MILLTAAESRELDRLSQAKFGKDSYTLMTRAGEACAEAVATLYPGCVQNGVVVVAGKGNNGGDGLVAGRRLLDGGIPTRVVLLGRSSDLRGDAARACDEFVARGGTVVQTPDEADLQGAVGQAP